MKNFKEIRSLSIRESAADSSDPIVSQPRPIVSGAINEDVKSTRAAMHADGHRYVAHTLLGNKSKLHFFKTKGEYDAHRAKYVTVGSSSGPFNSAGLLTHGEHPVTEAVAEPTGGLKKACWKGYVAVGTKMKGGRRVPNCVPKESSIDSSPSLGSQQLPVGKGWGEEYGAGFEGTPELTKKFKDETPGQTDEASGAGEFGIPVTPGATMNIETADSINLRITKHSKAAVEAGKKGDKGEQQYHLYQIKRLKGLEMKKDMNEQAGEEDMSGLSPAEVEQLKRLTVLIRLGLMDVKKLPVVQRAIKKLDTDTPITNLAEKQVLFELLENLIGLVTGDNALFNKLRLTVANTR